MQITRLDATSLRLLGDDNWLSVVALFGLADHSSAQFVLDGPAPLARNRASRYIRYINDKYIATYLASRNATLPDITLRQIFQVEDCPRKLKSAGWQSQPGWDDIALIPDPYYFMERGYEDFLPETAVLPAWSTRLPTVFWRGSTTGVVEGAGIYANGFGADSLDRLPRYRMCRILQELGAGADVGIVAVVQCPDADKDGITNRLRSEQLFASYTTPQDMTRYRFLVDIDGNANSWNLVQRLRLGCCLLKVDSPWTQWLSARMEPWVHYVPIRADLSDLLEKVEWCRTHDRDAERIAQNGRSFGLAITFEAEMRRAALAILRNAMPLNIDADDRDGLRELFALGDDPQPEWDNAIAAWSSFPEPMRLRTAHGTVLGSGLSGEIVQLSPLEDLAHAITLSDANDRWREQLRGVHIDRTGDTLRLERAGLFLSAHHDSNRTSCDRLEEGDWESFTLVPANTGQSG